MCVEVASHMSKEKILKTYKTYNSTIGFSKYEFCNKLLGGVTLRRVTLGVTLTQPSLSISLSLSLYIYISYHILYIIVEAERKLIPTIKEVLTNRIIAYLKFRHV